MKELFEKMENHDYEQVVFHQDEETGLKAITSIHDTTLGPALGGTRFWNYDTEQEALIDVLRLSRGMTYKAAAAGLNLGGGKTVIMGDPSKLKSEEFWRAFGRFIESLNGRYITAEDVNTTVDDMAYVSEETDHVTGLPGTSGDPSPVTAFGVWKAMKAVADEVYGTPDLEGKTVALQGVGHVGYHLAKHINEEGGNLIITDIKQENIDKVVEDFGAEVVDPDEIYGVDCDIFAPSALGAVVNDDTIPQFKCDIVCGAANNILAEERHGDILDEKGILYGPDYVANAGGLINVADELKGYDRDRAISKASKIYDNMKKVIEISKRDNIPTYKAADIMAEERIANMAKVKRNYLPR